MKIDDRVEPLFREAIAALVKADAERFQRALAAFPDEEAMTTAYRLAAAVAVYVLQDQYGRQPTQAEIRAVADKAALSWRAGPISPTRWRPSSTPSTVVPP